MDFNRFLNSQNLYLCRRKTNTETVNKRLKLQMATMEIDYNLKGLAKLFKLFPHI